jgi:hypothetical protein
MTGFYLDTAPFTVIACLGFASNADHGGGQEDWDKGRDEQALSHI